MKNVLYLQYVAEIGGIEQFLSYLSEKYKDCDITLYYERGDAKQLKRLSRNIKVIHIEKGSKFECDRLFINGWTFRHILGYFDAKEICFILHADYKALVEQNILSMKTIPVDDRINKYYAVSQLVADSWKSLTGIDAEVIYNPYLEKPKKKILRLAYCGRLSKEKGGDLVNKLVKRLDARNIEYQLFVYSNKDSIITGSKNIINLGTRLDASQFLCQDNYDYLLISSYQEGFCYSIVQALANGLPVVTTPCPVFKELGVNNSNSIKLEFDGSNVDSVIDEMITRKFDFNYVPKDDRWNKILVPGKSTYKNKIYKLIALCKYRDVVTNEVIKEGYIFEEVEERALQLLSRGVVKVYEGDKL